MTIFALLPFRAAGYVWLALNAVAMLATLRLVGRHLTGLPPADWPVTQLLPLVFLAAYWQWEFRLNQIDNFTLLLLVGSFTCWQQGRRAVGGFWLGLAVLLKLTPGLLVLWFLLKRQYRTVAVALLTVVLAGPVASAVALGPERTIEAYRAWAGRAIAGGSHAGLIRTQREMDWRNQGLGAVLCRWLHPTNYNTHFDNDPRFEAQYAEYEVKTMNVADLELSTVAYIVTAITVATLLGLIWVARRPAADLTLWQLRFEWVLFILAMLWLMPVMRRYHMVLALPVITVLGAGVHFSGLRSRWSWLALAGIGLTVAAQVALLFRPIEAAGSILASVGLLGLAVGAMLWRLQRDPAVMAGPFHAPPHPVRPAEASESVGGAARPAPVVAHG